MKDWGRKRVVLLRTLAALTGAGVFLFAYPSLSPLLEALLGRATLFSAALAMPGGALETVRQRYAPELYQEDDGPQPAPPSSQSQAPGSSSAPGEEAPSPSQGDPAPSSQPQQPPAQLLPPLPQGEPPEIPEEYQAPLHQVNMTGESGNPAFCRYKFGWIRNYTKLELTEIDQVLETPAALTLEPGPEPQVLIYHTHTTESYEEWDGDIYDSRNNWRSQDNTANMAAVGEELAQALEAHGIGVIHDITQHDYPAYNGAYDRSKAVAEQWLERYPSIKVVFDVHRDALVGNEGEVYKLVSDEAGQKVAQVMMVLGTDAGGADHPRWKDNLAFALKLQRNLVKGYASLARPTVLRKSRYNQQLCPGSVLVEVGGHGNSLSEAIAGGRLWADNVARTLLEMKE